jgi:hypothetical protein
MLGGAFHAKLASEINHQRVRRFELTTFALMR